MDRQAAAAPCGTIRSRTRQLCYSASEQMPNRPVVGTETSNTPGRWWSLEWCCHRGLNSGPLPYQGSALPLSYGSLRRFRGCGPPGGRGGDVAIGGATTQARGRLIDSGRVRREVSGWAAAELLRFLGRRHVAGVGAGPADPLPGAAHRGRGRGLHHGRRAARGLCRGGLSGGGHRVAGRRQGRGRRGPMVDPGRASHARGADPRSRRRDPRPRGPTAPPAGPDPDGAGSAPHQRRPGAEAARHALRGCRGAGGRGPAGRQAGVGQPEHAIRPVDAGAQAACRGAATSASR